MLTLGQKRQIQTKKGPKWAQLDFFPDCKPQFFKEDNNMGFYTNKRAMLGSLGGGKINKKKHKNGGGQSKSCKNDNNK